MLRWVPLSSPSYITVGNSFVSTVGDKYGAITLSDEESNSFTQCTDVRSTPTRCECIGILGTKTIDVMVVLKVITVMVYMK